MSRFELLDNFLDTNQLAELQNFFQINVLWTYGWQSDVEKTPFSHWNHDFLNTPTSNQDNYEHLLAHSQALAPIYKVWRKLKAERLQDHSLVRCYANAHTFGVEGYPHVDSRKPGNFTTIVYVNPIWKPEWAGETVFINDLGDIAHAVLPKPGRITIFDGRLTHAARGLSRICPAMRVTLMFKTTAPGAENDSAQA